MAFTLEGHGRESQFVSEVASSDHFNDIEILRTVGWFTSMFPVVVNVSDTSAIVTALKEVKEQLRAIPNKGIGFGILKYLSENSVASELSSPVR